MYWGLFLECLLQATSGARNPNLQVVITHASHVCSLHSFGPLLRMNGLHRAQFGHARSITCSITCNLMTLVWTILYVKLTQSIAMEQKLFELRLLLTALRNLWLLRWFKLVPVFARNRFKKVVLVIRLHLLG